MSTPYAVSSDLVSAYPAKSLAIAQFIDGYKTSLAMVQNTQTGTSYTFALADFTKLVTLSNAAAVAVTLPLEATVAWETGTQLRLVNLGAGTVTVAGAVGVTINGTPLTLAQYKGANLIKTGTNTWVFVPFASGIGAAVYSDANTGTYTGYAYKTFSSSGTLTVTTAGFADIALAGGGGGGGNSTLGAGGGAGGVLLVTNAYLPVGTLTITIGAAGAGASANSDGGTNGISTRFDSYYAIGGGGAAGGLRFKGQPGGSGGGGRNDTAGAGTPGQGFAGFNGGGSVAGGGGGASAAATNINGAAGTTTSIGGQFPLTTYTAGAYALGGGGGGRGTSSGGSGGGGGSVADVGQDGTANTGGGGGGGGGTGIPGNGGSGILIVRVAV